MEVYSLSVLRVRSLKSRCQQDPLKILEKSPSSSLSSWWHLAILGSCWLVAASLRSVPSASHGVLSAVSVFKFPFSCKD